MMIRCNNCFKEYDSELDMCPHCGYEEGDPASEPYFLYPGMVLHDRYIVGQVLGFGGFGITYKAWDKNLNTVVAIKEYYYTGVVTRQPGTQDVTIYAQNRRAEFQHFLNRFLDEARYTAKFSKNSNIVNIFEFFEANNTAYMVMEYLEGTPLNELLKQNAMDTEQCVSVMQSICSALKTVHSEGIIHRDISPDNIFLCSSGKVKLIDFGAARFSKREDQQTVKLTQVMKPGFSPPEQYQSISEQGPWTDIYALGATLYYMITGTKPVESTNRKAEDNLIPPKEIKADIPDYINDTILRAMAVDMHLRFTSADEFEKALMKEKKVLSVAKEKKRRRKKRLIGLLTAVFVVAIGLSVFSYQYNQQKLAETLPDSTVELWYSLTGSETLDTAKKGAFDEIVKTFNESFPNVTIVLKSYAKDDYIGAINAAYKKDALPPLFESNGLDVSILQKALSAQKAVKTVSSDNVLFFGSYSKVFPDAKQFPLGFIAPAEYTNKTPHSEIEATGSEREVFLAGKTDKYTGVTADFYDVQKSIPGLYSVTPVTEKNVSCTFTDLWSIGKCDEDQMKVVNRLLVFMLSENAQDHLHIQYRSGSLPLNKKALLEGYVSVYDDFEGFFENISDYKFS